MKNDEFKKIKNKKKEMFIFILRKVSSQIFPSLKKASGIDIEFNNNK